MLEIDGGFHEKKTRRLPLRQLSTIRNTAMGMKLYFNGELRDPRPLRDLLASDTLDYLWEAKRGLARRLRLNEVELLPYQLEEACSILEYSLNPGQENVAFNLTLVAFALMPELMIHPRLPQGFSRRGMFAPPRTYQEFYSRIDELREEVQKIVAGQITPSDIRTDIKPSLWRTYAFFLTGYALPLKMPPSLDEQGDQLMQLFPG
ncbi:MAG: hypothetical protein A3C27_01800 [Candidatus Levybacteria bacterium RIFCSPHIGHO2_02_FULL_39_36]|nr:MAG: hypothetical protein UT20_C0007G0033 [Candidatus Levybacteria bacterium GW2011_GWA1_39_11]KKR24748.1 MAG: hypothetical protein UT56_C0009G0013 [Candidatus Levybacteria bacterium GW2011_GWB1_39_7]KKR26667.1 MAG: hypothetical protein UT57_C0029G0006 [Microgenomates group bacterium GW2011_GWC1_39_7]OGH15240.1 MAG: hypothetical protein A2689_00980 [Candidatus Levybacteria bacterium RIFCSPHIGHO2_01_FULL_38_96]OGH25750.1 MAG: hypothetical protein A3E68_01715 [Candidatus Levybacteria bacterium